MIPKKKLNEIIKLLPIASIDCIIKINNKFLLLKRKNPPAKHRFTFPGSIIQKKNSINKSIKNILKNELGIISKNKPKLFDVKKFFFNINFSDKRDKVEYVSLLFLINLTKEYINKIKIDKNHSEFILIRKNELLKNKKVLNQVRLFIKNSF